MELKHNNTSELLLGRLKNANPDTPNQALRLQLQELFVTLWKVNVWF